MTMLFLWGLFLFLVGLEICKWSLKKAISGKIENIITGLSGNLFSCILLGILITSVIQSSSAVSVIIIGLIEAGVLSLKPALAIIMGSNIGTTVTVQIISLPVLDKYPHIIILGIIIILIGLFINKRLMFTGLALVAFGIVFAGLVMMTDFFKNPSIIELFKRFLTYTTNNSLLGILLGIFVTGLVQSSSVVTGITLGLARSGIINLVSAIAIALGSNIGTCITAFIASLNCSRISKMMATGHFIFNLIGVIVLLPFLNIFCKLVGLTSSNLMRQIANAHTLFNIFNVLLFLPFINDFADLLGGDRYGID